MRRKQKRPDQGGDLSDAAAMLVNSFCSEKRVRDLEVYYEALEEYQREDANAYDDAPTDPGHGGKIWRNLRGTKQRLKGTT